MQIRPDPILAKNFSKQSLTAVESPGGTSSDADQTTTATNVIMEQQVENLAEPLQTIATCKGNEQNAEVDDEQTKAQTKANKDLSRTDDHDNTTKQTSERIKHNIKLYLKPGEENHSRVFKAGGADGKNATQAQKTFGEKNADKARNKTEIGSTSSQGNASPTHNGRQEEQSYHNRRIISERGCLIDKKSRQCSDAKAGNSEQQLTSLRDMQVCLRTLQRKNAMARQAKAYVREQAIQESRISETLSYSPTMSKDLDQQPTNLTAIRRFLASEQHHQLEEAISELFRIESYLEEIQNSQWEAKGDSEACPEQQVPSEGCFQIEDQYLIKDQQGQSQQKLAIVNCLDISESMGNKPGFTITQEAIAFLTAAAQRLAVPVGILSFNDSVNVIKDLDHHSKDWCYNLEAITPGGGMNCSKVLQTATQMLSRARAAVKIVVVITDGNDSGNHFTRRYLERVEESLGIRVIGIGIGPEGYKVRQKYRYGINIQETASLSERLPSLINKLIARTLKVPEAH